MPARLESLIRVVLCVLPVAACAADAPENPTGSSVDAGSASDAGETAPGDAGTAPDAGPDAGSSIDASVPPEVDAGTPPLWDLALLRDESDARCEFANPRSTMKDLVPVDVWDVTYVSYESVDGVLRPIRVRGFAARPSLVAGTLPGVVHAHGLGGEATPDNATGPAALTGMFVLAYTGPGGGSASNHPPNDSEGLPAMHDGGRRLFDTVPDVRGSWFWAHAAAAMRALTCLAARPGVDASRLGITGFSAGGVISLVAAGVDDRVKAAVPLSGTHAWSVAVQSPDAWQRGLLAQAGYSVESPEWLRLQEAIVDPGATVAHTSGRVLLVDGTCDEFFPLTALMATYEALPGDDKRISLAANFDHGCFAISGPESASVIEERASAHARGAQRMWLRHWLASDAAYAALPATPVLQLAPAGGATLLSAQVDVPAGYEVASVRAWASNDGAYVFFQAALDPAGGGLWAKLLPMSIDPAATVAFADVEYALPGLRAGERFHLSSLPTLPAGFVPRIRSMTTCR